MNVDDNTHYIREFVQSYAEVNGRFARFTSWNKLEWLKYDTKDPSLYPSTTLYPNSLLFPEPDGRAREITGDEYIDVSYSDEMTTKIVNVIITNAHTERHGLRSENTYTISQSILTNPSSWNDNTYPNFAGVFYKTVSMDGDEDNNMYYQPIKNLKILHNPSIKVGDRIKVITVDGEEVNSIVLSKTTQGVYSMTDTIVSNGVVKYNN